MELHVVETEGIPEGCVISVRAGSTRRQAPVSADRPFRFPTPLAEAVPFKVDVLEPVASARLILRPGEERRTDCQYTIPLEPAPAEGSGKEIDGAAGLAAKAPAPDMNVTIAVKPSDEEKKSGVEEPEDKNATKVVLDAGTEGDASRPSTNPKAKRGSSGSAASSRHGQANAAGARPGLSGRQRRPMGPADTTAARKAPAKEEVTLAGRRSAAHSDSSVERRRFWISVCENGAASEVVVNLWLPWFLSNLQGGVLQAPSDFTVNTVVLLLNLVSAWMEGFAKSARLLTQTLHRSNPAHQAVFVLSHGFSLGFLNVSSSFPDVGGGASDAALATGSSIPGLLYILANMLGSLWLYRVGRTAGWRAVQRRWSGILAFCRVWPSVVRGALLVSFLFVFVGPRSMGHRVPLDLGDPEMGGIESVRLVYDDWVIRFPPQPLGLAFGIFMSILGCIAAALCSEFWLEEEHRCFARLAANFISTVVVLAVQQQHLGQDSRSFMLMKFSSSFCGAFSAFSSTIGDVYDDTFGAPEEEPPLSEPSSAGSAGKGSRGAEHGRGMLLTGLQNFAFHSLMTVSIMMLGIYMGPADAPPPILLRSEPRERLPGAFSRALGSDHSWGAARPSAFRQLQNEEN